MFMYSRQTKIIRFAGNSNLKRDHMTFMLMAVYAQNGKGVLCSSIFNVVECHKN